MKCIFNRFHNNCCILTIDSTYIIFRYDEISNAVYVSLEKTDCIHLQNLFIFIIITKKILKNAKLYIYCMALHIC